MIATAPAVLTLTRIAQLAGGDLVVREVPAGAAAREAFLAAGVEGASLDTRTLRPGMLFVPLPGRNSDGHDFLGEAHARGAAAHRLRASRRRPLSAHDGQRQRGLRPQDQARPTC